MAGNGYDFLEDEPEDPPSHIFPFTKSRAYVCEKCHRGLTFSHVLYMSRITDDAFMLGYTCPCTNNKTLMEQRFKVDRQAMKNLLQGLRPQLPYRAAPGPYLSLTDESEKCLQVFAFDLDGIETVEDFLRYCNGPRD